MPAHSPSERLTTSSNVIPLFTLLFLLSAVLPVQEIKAQYNGKTTFYGEDGHAEFRSSVPTHEFTGESDYLVGRLDLEESVADFYVDLTTLDTGVQERDEDMYETLNVEEHPFGEFFGTLLTPVDLELKEPQEAKVRGEFTLNGVTNVVEVMGSIEPVEKGLLVKADWKIDLMDYNIEPPGILFYRVSEVQKVQISILLTPGNP